MDTTLVKITHGFTNAWGRDFIVLGIKDKQLIVFHHLNMVVNTENGYETEFIKGCFVFENELDLHLSTCNLITSCFCGKIVEKH